MTAADTREWSLVAFLDHEDDPATMANPVHSTDFARALGFDGALVGGATVWGWAVPAIIETLGDGWLEHGWARFRFRQPVYPGDAVRITLSPEDGGAFALRMINPAGVDCVVGEVGLGPNAALSEFEAAARMDPAPSPAPQPELRVDPSLVGADWTPMAADASPETLRRGLDAPAPSRLAGGACGSAHAAQLRHHQLHPHPQRGRVPRPRPGGWRGRHGRALRRALRAQGAPHRRVRLPRTRPRRPRPRPHASHHHLRRDGRCFVIDSIAGFLRYFDGVHRRALRDVAALPPEAAAWKPPAGEGEASWDIPELVAHIARSRGFFVGVYHDEGWIMPPPPDTSSPERWAVALEESAAALQARLQDTPDEWLQRRVPLIEGDATLAGWRVLMMLLEHEVHHRSQIDTYAGLNAPPDIFGMSAEGIDEREALQRQRLADREA